MNILTCSAPSSTRPFIDGKRACVTSNNWSAVIATDLASFFSSPVEDAKRDHKQEDVAVLTACAFFPGCHFRWGTSKSAATRMMLNYRPSILYLHIAYPTRNHNL